ncbi:Uncharacterised protein [Bordetella pertussis]|nr:Uncharacterised protein [Bordetella pertussis]
MMRQVWSSIGVVQRVIATRANSLGVSPSSQMWPTCARLGSTMSLERTHTLSSQRRDVT